MILSLVNLMEPDLPSILQKFLLIESGENIIDGTIPTEIGKMTALTVLKLGECECFVDVVDAPLLLFCLSYIQISSHCGSFK